MALEELAGLDLPGHVLRVLAIDRPVLELDHRILALTAQALDVVPLSAKERPLHDLVVDPLLVERALDTPARVPLDLDPHVWAAVELDGHLSLRTSSG